MPLITYSMLVLAGVCLYAGLHFLIHYAHGRYTCVIPNSLYLLFALMCLLAVGFIGLELAVYRSQDALEYVRAFQWREAFAGIFLGIWPWFVYRYTNVGPRTVVIGLSGYFALLVLITLVRPYGGTFAALPEVSPIALPWGEQISFHAQPRMNWYGISSLVGVLLLVSYTYYASVCQYRRGQRQPAILLGAGMSVFIALVFENLSVRAGLLDFIFLAQYGFPALIVIMGISLHRQAHEYIERIQTVLDQVPAMVYMKDQEGRYLYINRTYENNFRITASDMIGHTDYDLFDRQQADSFRANDEDVLVSGHSVTFEEVADHTDGSKHTYRSVKFPLYKDTSVPYAVCGISADITQQKELQSKYQSLFDHANDIILLADAYTGRILDVNPAASKLYGYRRDELLAMTIYDLSSRENVKDVSALIKQLRNNHAMVFEREHRCKDGRILPVEVSSRQIELGGRPVFLSLIRDISERNKFEIALRQSEQRLAEAQRVAHIGHWELDLVSTKLIWSDEIYRIFGIDPATHEASYDLFIAAIHPDDREQVNKAYAESVKNHTPYTIEHRLSLADGTIKYVQERGETHYSPDGTPLRSIGTVQDITERRRYDEAIKNIAAGVSAQSGEEFFQQLVRHLGMIFAAKYAFIGLLDEHDSHQVKTIAASADGEIVDNISYRLEDTPCANVIGDQTCAYPENVQKMFPKDHLLVEMGAQGYIGAPLFDARQKPIGLLVVLDTKPLTNMVHIKPILEIFAARASAELERVKSERHIRRLAFEDYLTGLGNRAALHEHLSSVLARSRSRSAGGAMLLIDLDHFKTINDALSHDVGDHVLRLVGQRLRETAGDAVYLARIGGDEFVAVMTGQANATNGQIEDAAYTLAVNIVLALESPFILDQRILNIGASIGLVLFPQHGDNELDILRRADMALYRAKNQGRGNVQVYQPDLQKIANERLQIERGLRHAIEHHELSLHYQPLVAADGKVFGAEALLRWHHPELGDVSPSRFIPVAEETGLIHTVGAWVIEAACQQLRAWQDTKNRFDGYLSINVSAWQFASANFVGQVLDVLARYRLESGHIVLELTETALLYDVQETIVKLKSLQAAGLRIALDDFGTGYSSLAYLKDIPIDILKIDKAFIAELTQTNEHPLVETIIAMGHHMNLNVIAEGVETGEQKETLENLGCRAFQGYHFCRPLAEPDFIKWLMAHSHKPGNQQLA